MRARVDRFGFYRFVSFRLVSVSFRFVTGAADAAAAAAAARAWLGDADGDRRWSLQFYLVNRCRRTGFKPHERKSVNFAIGVSLNLGDSSKPNKLLHSAIRGSVRGSIAQQPCNIHLDGCYI